ncbi:response regulator [Luteolibacter ambystomatis]|uniref:histidine kinase n=1 Tax=Luteolibacter ambystomatis TaxID=2824561 RepID=A0A975J174_9BACT|nr:response regulator [Luteolibacter ambystomatis]QUE52147.1 response regulator [Luteolibacter ambystomatis]
MPYHKPIKFLLVDDLEANLVALEALFMREGLELLKARSGREALELLLVHEVALAFIDVQMPEMSGFELAEIMRSTERTRGTPIIFLTAGTVSRQWRIRGTEAGAIDFLPKPVDPAMLLNKARVFFDLALQRQELQESERKLKVANEKLALADRSKDEFLAMLAHELRNPLAPLLAGADLLLASPGNVQTGENIGRMMKRQVGQMARLIDDLLDVSRITNGKIELQKQAVLLSGIFEQAVESVQPQINRMGHHLEVHHSETSLGVSADPYRLTQVVSNLLSNAAKYTPPGGRIRLTAVKSADGKVAISIKDNGRGIRPEDQRSIFNLFDQGSCATEGGLGIGLTLVKWLVEMHGGVVSVRSEGEGRGSEFTIELPAIEIEPPAVPELVVETGSQEKLRILIADDGESTADILGMFFQMEGMETLVVYDGEKAVKEAESFCPDIACLDLGMPFVDGFAAAREVRKICPDAYIVALSGWGSEADRLKTAAAGFDEHLVKPVSPEDLRSLLTRVTEAK